MSSNEAERTGGLFPMQTVGEVIKIRPKNITMEASLAHVSF